MKNNKKEPEVKPEPVGLLQTMIDAVDDIARPSSKQIIHRCYRTALSYLSAPVEGELNKLRAENEKLREAIQSAVILIKALNYPIETSIGVHSENIRTALSTSNTLNPLPFNP
jgi:hypothetical protein